LCQTYMFFIKKKAKQPKEISYKAFIYIINEKLE